MNMQSAPSLQEMFPANFADSSWQNSSRNSNILVTPALRAVPAETLWLPWLTANPSQSQCTIHLPVVMQSLAYICIIRIATKSSQNAQWQRSTQCVDIFIWKDLWQVNSKNNTSGIAHEMENAWINKHVFILHVSINLSWLYCFTFVVTLNTNETL